MKLLIAADIFPPESGGPATYVVTLANELVKQGVQVAVVSLNPNSDRSVLDSRVELAMVSSSVKLLRYWQYYQMLKQCGKSADLIYAMGPVNAGYPALRAAQKLGIKLVVKVVGDYAWEQGQVLGLTREPVDDFQRTKHGGKIGRLKKIEARVVKAADQVITPSEYLKKIVVGWGAEEKKVQVIYNEVPFEPVNSLVHPGEHWIVSAGRLVPWKKMETLIEVMPEVLKKVPDAKLKIVGDGPEFAALASKISKLHLENVVELTVVVYQKAVMIPSAPPSWAR
jgi:glycosyltransferase involved in cell wall biosynthesis